MAMPRETTPLIGKPGHARSLYDRAADWVVSYPATSVVLGVLGLLAATTAIVVPVEWSELETGTPPVCSKGGITAVLGPGTEAQRLFVFSGNTKHGQLLSESKTFGVDDGVWRRPSIVGDAEFGEPSPRWKAVAVSSASGSEVVLFGGETKTRYASDLWVLDASEGDSRWSFVQLAENATVPVARKAAAAARLGDQMLVYGGKHCHATEEGTMGGCRDLSDLWSLNLTDLRDGWTKVWEAGGDAGSGPSPRHGHTATVARLEGKGGALEEYLVIFAGRTDSVGYYNDVWAWSPSRGAWFDWTPDYDHTAEVSVPAKRDHHHACSSADGSKMILYGGRGDPSTTEHQHSHSTVLGDLWELDYSGRRWREVVSGGRKPRPRYLADFAESGGAFYIFGGDTSVEPGGRVNDLWRLNTTTYEFEELRRGYVC